MIIHLDRPLNTISPRDKKSAVDQNWDTDFWFRPCRIFVIVVVRYIDINFLKNMEFAVLLKMISTISPVEILT